MTKQDFYDNKTNFEYYPRKTSESHHKSSLNPEAMPFETDKYRLLK
jgi:hypothetical protein